MKRIVYIEDDIVDQMAFKRLMQVHFSNIPYQCYSSFSTFKAAQAQHHNDILITDNHLGDGGSAELIALMPHHKLIVVSGTSSPQFQASANPAITFVAKPIAAEALAAALTWYAIPLALSTSKKNYINLSYLKQLAGDDKTFLDSILLTSLAELEKDLAQLQTAIAARDYKGVKFCAHKLKSRSHVLGLGYEARALAVESNASPELDVEIQSFYQLFQEAFEPIKNEIEAIVAAEVVPD